MKQKKNLREVLYCAWFRAGAMYGDCEHTTKIRMYIEDRLGMLFDEEWA